MVKIDKGGPAADPQMYNHRLRPRTDPLSGGDAAAGERSDTVTLSPAARELQGARKLIETLPDIDAEKVAAVKKQLREGTYTVDSRTIAAKMIEDAIVHGK